MDNTKFTIPNLPAPQCILEDLSNPDVLKHNQPLKFTEADKTLQEAYTCFNYFKSLKADVLKHDEMISKLDELSVKLSENLAKLRTGT